MKCHTSTLFLKDGYQLSLPARTFAVAFPVTDTLVSTIFMTRRTGLLL